MKTVILMAGIGSRLGNPFPKCLTPLRDGCSILDQQLANLTEFKGNIIGVVGFKKDLILERHPELLYVYNPRYDQTNTSKSLLCALEHVAQEDVLWLNGDVVFDARIIPELLRCPHSTMAVVTTQVSEEEIKFTVDKHGFINAVSKQLTGALGEAIGINLVRAKDLDLFRQSLQRCADQDYFERGLEFSIQNGLALYPTDVSRYSCVEVDFEEDLRRAKQIFTQTNQ